MAALIRAQTRITGGNGLPGLATIYFGGGSSPTTIGEATDALARVRAFWNAVRGLMPAAITMDAVNPVQTLDDVTGALLFLTTAAPPAQVTGSGTNSLPTATTLIAQWFTATIVGSRLLRGHTNISPVSPATATSLGAPSAGTVTTVLAGMAALGAGSTAITQRIWHRPAPGGGGGSSALVTSYGVGSQYGVLRSRRD